jgi:hypothetical protein
VADILCQNRWTGGTLVACLLSSYASIGGEGAGGRRSSDVKLAGEHEKNVQDYLCVIDTEGRPRLEVGLHLPDRLVPEALRTVCRDQRRPLIDRRMGDDGKDGGGVQLAQKATSHACLNHQETAGVAAD